MTCPSAIYSIERLQSHSMLLSSHMKKKTPRKKIPNCLSVLLFLYQSVWPPLVQKHNRSAMNEMKYFLLRILSLLIIILLLAHFLLLLLRRANLFSNSYEEMHSSQSLHHRITFGDHSECCRGPRISCDFTVSPKTHLRLTIVRNCVPILPLYVWSSIIIIVVPWRFTASPLLSWVNTLPSSNADRPPAQCSGSQKYTRTLYSILVSESPSDGVDCWLR